MVFQLHSTTDFIADPLQKCKLCQKLNKHIRTLLLLQLDDQYCHTRHDIAQHILRSYPH